MPNVRHPQTLGEATRVANLLSLAKREFGAGLSKADRDVVQAAALGEFAWFGNHRYYIDLAAAIAAEQAAVKANEPLPPAADRPKPSTTVTPSVIRWLLTSEAALEHVHAAGVRISGVWLESTLDLQACVCERPLMVNAAWLEGVDLLDAQCKTIAIQRSLVKAGEMGFAMVADGVRVTGGVFLRNGFRSEGEVRLLGAEIGGDLDCEHGVFLNAGGTALTANGVRVTGGVFFRDGFRAEGEVNVLGAEIGSALECDQGVFLNAGGYALSANGVRVTGSVFFREGFRAEGEVDVLGAEIGRALECDQGVFLNAGGYALSADGVRVTGSVFFREGFRAEGVVNLTRARVGRLDDTLTPPASSDWPTTFAIEGFEYDSIASRAPLDAKRRLAWLANHDDAVRRGLPHLKPSERPDPRDPPDPQPYRQLAEVLRKQGHEQDARTVMRVCAERRMLPLVRRRLRDGATAWWLLIVASVLLTPLLLAIAFDEANLIGTFFGLAFGVSLCMGVVCWLDGTSRKMLGIVAFAVELVGGCLSWILLGFGYARWRVIAWAVIFTMLGVWVFGAASQSGMQPTQARALVDWEKAVDAGWTVNAGNMASLEAFVEAQRRSRSDSWIEMNDVDLPKADDYAWVASYPQFNAVVYSLDTFLPLVSFGQESAWTLRNGERWSGRWWAKQVYLPFHIASGWVIATLFVASFTKLMRPE